MGKRIIAYILVFVILIGACPLNVFAQQAGAVTSDMEMGDAFIEGTDGFGRLLSESVADNQELVEAEQGEYPGGYAVTDLIIEGSTATVSYSSIEEALLVVALYTEDGMQMLCSANTSVNPDADKATLTFAGEMPEYFMASGFLLDIYDMSPLCPAYDTPIYTKEMQELLDSVAEDYDEDLILKLDDSGTTNFAVYEETTKIIAPIEGTNVVVSANEETLTYVLENVDAQITGLVPGDIFAYGYGENQLLIVKVAQIVISGTTATITGDDELEMEDVFSHMKIEETGTTTDMTVAEEGGDEGVIYEGLQQEVQTQTVNSSVDFAGVSMPTVEENDNIESKFSMSFSIQKQIDESTKITGSLGAQFEMELEYYITPFRQYVRFEYKANARLNISFSCSSKHEFDKIKLQPMGYSPVPGLFIGFEPKLVFEISATVELTCSIGYSGGFSYEVGKSVDNLNKKPSVTLDPKLEGTVFFGVDFAPTISILSGNVAKITLSSEVGLELSGELTGKKYDPVIVAGGELPESIHDCDSCLKLELYAKMEFELKIQLLKSSWLSANFKLAAERFILGECHYSITHSDFGFGECPYKSYLITVTVLSEDNKLLDGAEVTVSGQTKTANSRGVAVFYLTAGNHTFRAEANGSTQQRKVRIQGSQKVELKMGVTYKYQTGTIGHIDTSTVQIRTGKCGDNLYWECYNINDSDSSSLVISGSGLMYSYGSANDVPWSKYAGDVSVIQIKKGVTSVSANAFSGCTQMKELWFWGDPPAAGENAFPNVTAKAYHHGANSAWTDEIRKSYGTNYEWTSFYTQLGSGSCGASLHWDMTDSGRLTISGSGDMYDFTYDTVPWKAFRQKIKSMVLEGNITRIGSYAFSGCENLMRIWFECNAPAFGTNVFQDVIAEAYCPDQDNTWTDAVKQNYGGTITWNISVLELGSGSCGDLITWRLESDGDLFISGSGAMSDFDEASVPWAAHAQIIREIHFGENITHIGRNMFSGCTNLEAIRFTGDLPELESDAFAGVTATVYYPVDNDTWADAVGKDYGGNITWSEGLTLIAAGSCGDTLEWFYMTGGYLLISGRGKMYDFTAGTAPWNQYKAQIEWVNISENVTGIGDYAFAGCTGLEKVVFAGNAPTFGENTFSGVAAKAEYPAGNVTWTDAAKQNYGGSITWNPSQSEGEAARGSCGEYVTWVIYENGTMVIYGTGAMYDYTMDTLPWKDFRSTVTSVIIREGITRVGNYAFGGCTELESIWFDGDAPEFGSEVFSGVSAYAYYEQTIDTWTEDVRKQYGGQITWAPIISDVSEGSCGDAVTWKLNSNGCLTISGSGAMDDYTLTPTPWAGIKLKIETLRIESGVTRIGDYAFSGCKNLREITFYGNAPEFGPHAFESVQASASYPAGKDGWTMDITQDYGGSIRWNVYWTVLDQGSCGDTARWEFLSDGTLSIIGTGAVSDFSADTVPWIEYADSVSSVNISSGITALGDYAFNGLWRVTDVELPDSVTHIGDRTFASCTALTALRIPENVASVGSGAFSGCTALTQIVFKGNPPAFESDSFEGLTAKIVYPKDNAAWTAAVMQQYGGTITWEEQVMSGSAGENVVWDIAEGILTLSGSGAMYDYQYVFDAPWVEFYDLIESVVIGNGITHVGSAAFGAIENLTAVTLADSVESIGAGAFVSCVNLAQINLPEGLILIGDAAFADCPSLTTIDLPDSLQTIGINAFAGSGISEITIPAATTSVQFGAFNNANLKKVAVAPGNKSYLVNSGHLFSADGTVLHTYASAAPDTSYHIPDGITTIYDMAFSYSQNLAEVYIPASVTAVNDSAFVFSKSLTDVYFEGDAPQIGQAIFAEVSAVTVHYPEDNTTWTPAVLQSFGENVTCVPYTVSETGTVDLPAVENAQSVESDELVIVEQTEETEDSSVELPSVDAVFGGEYGSEISDLYVIRTAKFKNLVPGEEYVLLAMVSMNAVDPLAPENLLFIDQKDAGADGTLEFRYIQRDNPEVVYAIACGASNKNLKDAMITFPEMMQNGELQTVSPIVVYQDETLLEGRDYVVLGNTAFTESGEYTITIRGIRNYTGLVVRTYSVSFVSASAITLNRTEGTLEVGETLTLTASVEPENASDKKVVWTSSDDGIAVVDECGVVIAHGEGTAVITAAIGQVTAQCTVHVRKMTFPSGTTKTIQIEEPGQTVSFRFVPEHTGCYTLRSAGSAMAQGGFYDSSMNSLAFASGQPEFTVTCHLEAGREYVLSTGMVNPDSTGCFDITVSYEHFYILYSSVAASCTRDGENVYVCQVCDTPKTEIIPAHHTYEKGICTACGAISPDELTNVQYSGTCGKNLTWKLTQNGVLVISGTGAMDDYNMSSVYPPWNNYRTSVVVTIVENGVTYIGKNAFNSLSNMTRMVVADSVTSIGYAAFRNCLSLVDVTLPNRVETLGASMFESCKALKNIVVPDSIHTAGANMFYNCLSLESANIPAGLTEIPNSMFDGCNKLKEMEIPKGIVSIGQYAFRNCSSLTAVTIPDGVTTIGQDAFYKCASLTRVVLPNSVVTTTSTGSSGCFEACISLEEIVLSSGMQRLPDRILAGCTSLKTVVIPEGVAIIGSSIFSGCSNLQEITLPNSVTRIGGWAFSGCTNLTSCNIPTGVTEIGEGAFSNCKNLTELSMPDNVKKIGIRAFSNCESLTNIALPAKMTSLSNYLFVNCTGLTEVVIPDAVTTLGSYAFSGCSSLGRVVLADSVTSIGARAFQDCVSLTEFTLPTGISKLGNYVFSNSGLTGIVIGSNISELGNYVLADCSNLSEVKFEGDAPVFGENVFSNVTAAVYYPAENTTWTEAIKQQYGGTITWVVQGSVPEAGRFTIPSTNMTLGNSLAMNFWVNEADIVGEDYYAQIVKTYADGREDAKVQIPFSEWKYNSGYKMYYFTFDGIAAKEMGDELYVTVYTTDGTQVSQTKTDSIRDYVVRNIGKWTGETRTMGVDMLNYGAAAQSYFEYDAENPANAGMDDYQQYATQSVAMTDNRVKGTNYVGSTLKLESSIVLGLYFQNLTRDMNAVVTFTDHYGNEKTMNISGSEFDTLGSYLGVEVDELVIADGSQTVACVIYDADGNEVARAVDSVESYISRMSDLDTLFERIMKFSASSYAYFH